LDQWAGEQSKDVEGEFVEEAAMVAFCEAVVHVFVEGN
jgi:hypothetical protein